MDRLVYCGKFGLICALMGVPIAFILAALVDEHIAVPEFWISEPKGIELVVPVREVLQLMLAHRGTIRIASGRVEI